MSKGTPVVSWAWGVVSWSLGRGVLSLGRGVLSLGRGVLSLGPGVLSLGPGVLSLGHRCGQIKLHINFTAFCRGSRRCGRGGRGGHGGPGGPGGPGGRGGRACDVTGNHCGVLSLGSKYGQIKLHINFTVFCRGPRKSKSMVWPWPWRQWPWPWPWTSSSAKTSLCLGPGPSTLTTSNCPIWRKFFLAFQTSLIVPFASPNKQECIPVGCIPTMAVAISGGVCLLHPHLLHNPPCDHRCLWKYYHPPYFKHALFPLFRTDKIPWPVFFAIFRVFF